jgi:hypothetical protein
LLGLLFKPRSIPAYQQKPNPSRDPVSLRPDELKIYIIKTAPQKKERGPVISVALTKKGRIGIHNRSMQFEQAENHPGFYELFILPPSPPPEVNWLDKVKVK